MLRTLCLLLLALPLCGQQTVTAEGGMVVAAERRAAEIGAVILDQGGNAVDAAVAVSFALAVSFPRAGNLGGGGFLLYRPPGEAPVALDFREVAPATADRTMYLDEAGEPIPGASLVGPLAAGVPGTVAGLAEAHARYGQLPWDKLVAPAVRHAARGFVVDARLAGSLASSAERFAQFPAAATVFLPGGAAPTAGTLWRQPGLAGTLRAIRDEGSAGFYAGDVAAELARSCQEAGGLISVEDLAAYRPVWRDPVAFSYAGNRVYSMAPPSSGGLCMAGILTGLELLGADALEVGSPDWVHRYVEACRRAYADRYAFGDPDFAALPTSLLLDREYHAGRLADFDPARATPSAEVGVGFPRESEETTHLSVVDAAGGAVSLTTTLNGSYGSCFVAGGTGVLLNNEMDDFTTAPGRPNLYGLIQGEENTVAPGKRPLSSMSPTIVLDEEGELLWVLGSPGGSTIITTVVQLICRLSAGEDLASAVAAPRVHHQWLPDRIQYEKGTPAPWRDALEALGHEVAERSLIGRVHAIARLPDGRLVGAADPRSEGIAAGLSGGN